MERTTTLFPAQPKTSAYEPTPESRQPKVWRVYSDSGYTSLIVAVKRATAVREYEREHPGEMVLRAVDETTGVSRRLDDDTLLYLAHRAGKSPAAPNEE